MNTTRLRLAQPMDVPAIQELIARSARALSAPYYTPAQTEAAIRYVFGVDTRLIEDGTYYVVEEEGQAIACGGWSRRRTLFGGDQYADRSDDRLDPATEPARIRAFFVHPSWSRRGLGNLLLRECERAARANGFRQLELMATRTGEPFYARAGFRVLERVNLELPGGVSFSLTRMSWELADP